MTQEEKKEPVFKDEEIKEMFDNGFLKNITEIANRAKERDMKDMDVRFFQVHMRYQFNVDENITQYDQIKDRINLQIQPITQEDLDRAKQESEKSKVE